MVLGYKHIGDFSKANLGTYLGFDQELIVSCKASVVKLTSQS
jgi:hypothetical protein